MMSFIQVYSAAVVFNCSHGKSIVNVLFHVYFEMVYFGFYSDVLFSIFYLK